MWVQYTIIEEQVYFWKISEYELANNILNLFMAFSQEGIQFFTKSRSNAVKSKRVTSFR